MHFVSLLSGGFTTMAEINSPERKLAKRTSVESIVLSKIYISLVQFVYSLSMYSKFEWGENGAVQTPTKKLSGKQICCTTKWLL